MYSFAVMGWCAEVMRVHLAVKLLCTVHSVDRHSVKMAMRVALQCVSANFSNKGPRFSHLAQISAALQLRRTDLTRTLSTTSRLSTGKVFGVFSKISRVFYIGDGRSFPEFSGRKKTVVVSLQRCITKWKKGMKIELQCESDEFDEIVL